MQSEDEEDVNVPHGYYLAEKLLKQKSGRYLVKWAGFPESSNTWEPRSNLTPALIAHFEKEKRLRKARKIRDSETISSKLNSTNRSDKSDSGSVEFTKEKILKKKGERKVKSHKDMPKSMSFIKLKKKSSVTPGLMSQCEERQYNCAPKNLFKKRTSHVEELPKLEIQNDAPRIRETFDGELPPVLERMDFMLAPEILLTTVSKKLQTKSIAADSPLDEPLKMTHGSNAYDIARVTSTATNLIEPQKTTSANIEHLNDSLPEALFPTAPEKVDDSSLDMPLLSISQDDPLPAFPLSALSKENGSSPDFPLTTKPEVDDPPAISSPILSLPALPLSPVVSKDDTLPELKALPQFDDPYINMAVAAELNDNDDIVQQLQEFLNATNESRILPVSQCLIEVAASASGSPIENASSDAIIQNSESGTNIHNMSCETIIKISDERPDSGTEVASASISTESPLSNTNNPVSPIQDVAYFSAPYQVSTEPNEQTPVKTKKKSRRRRFSDDDRVPSGSNIVNFLDSLGID